MADTKLGTSKNISKIMWKNRWEHGNYVKFLRKLNQTKKNENSKGWENKEKILG